jgi:hypothetical protein
MPLSITSPSGSSKPEQLGSLGAPAREPLMLIEQDARRLGAIVLGHDSAYDATPWNFDNRLGMYSGSCCQRKQSTTDAPAPRCSRGWLHSYRKVLQRLSATRRPKTASSADLRESLST